MFKANNKDKFEHVIAGWEQTRYYMYYKTQEHGLKSWFGIFILVKAEYIKSRENPPYVGRTPLFSSTPSAKSDIVKDYNKKIPTLIAFCKVLLLYDVKVEILLI